MFCPRCGTSHADTDAFCGSCGAPLTATRAATIGGGAQPVAPRRAPAAADSELVATLRSVARERPALESLPSSSTSSAVTFGAIGLVLGALAGFVMRPSVFLIGQLPLGTVLTRGSNLSGMDQLLVPAAQSSFNLMVVAALVGAAIGAAVGVFLDKSAAQRSGRTARTGY
jgi:zinc-ribbon domain